MEISDALSFAESNHRAVLTTRRRDDGIQSSPVITAALDGRIVISSRASLAKVRNLLRDPRASIVITTDAFFGRWVQIDGTATIRDQSDPATLDRLVEVYRAIAGEHPDWDDYRRSMVVEERVVIEIAPERVSGQLG
ncbi:PPOX class F420-dependent enzyme [Enemella evansiae]|uniref:PPOX class F420-dependent enzyme n=1 Tax=Enemella evansiae TaxID=2016499 RepID=A0A255FY69_9ACTN|nr:PPOX class F420-dependent oxidoreductase [Enemella evansiae]OYO07123.1 PPOX class F420-dependent enzyme [Enemella evansiae]OYO08627.1 PPOX class F420-dependent enzyme [Enemella evansiae]